MNMVYRHVLLSSNECVCVCVCVCVCMCVSMCACMLMCACMHVYMCFPSSVLLAVHTVSFTFHIFYLGFFHSLLCSVSVLWTQHKQEKQMLRQLIFKCKVAKIMLVMSPKDTRVTQSILCLMFITYTRTIQCLNYSGQEFKNSFSLWFWHTCDLETRSSNLVWIDRPQASL